MPPDDGRDYLDPEVPPGMLRRSASQLNTAFDQGVDPYTGRGISGAIPAARSNARMMEGLIPSYGVGGMGSINPRYANTAVALRTGSGSPYDDPIKGGAHYNVPRSMSGSVFGGQVSAEDLEKIQGPGRKAHRDALAGTAHDAEMFARKQLGTYQSMSQAAGPELTQLFNSLPANQQADLLEKPPADIVAALRNHPLRKTAPKAPTSAALPPSMFPTITPRSYSGDRPAAFIDSLSEETNLNPEEVLG